MSTQDQPLSLRKTKTSSLTTGLALFSMFFGAGNLIFPLLIGQLAGQNIWFAILGLGITAVLIPFLGLVSMTLFQANHRLFFEQIGKIPGAILLLLLQLIIGPIGVIPRLITLMHATLKSHLSEIPLSWFSIIVAVVILGSTFKRNKLINLLGTYLTPLLLLCLAALIFLGLTDGSYIGQSSASIGECFFQGLLEGYNTMDLIAAFLFSSLVFPQFKNRESYQKTSFTQEEPLKNMLISFGIAGSLLFLSYIGLALLSAHHRSDLHSSLSPEQILDVIAIKILGNTGGLLAAITVVIACLTTAITLASIFSDYLQKELCRKKIDSSSALIATLLITTLFANLGFSGIRAFLSPILEIVYPGLIAITFLNLLYALYGYKKVKSLTFLTFLISFIVYLAKKWV